MVYVKHKSERAESDVMNITEIKNRAIRVEEQMQVCWPQKVEYDCIRLKEFGLSQYKKTYSCQNGIIAFIDEASNLYVIPILRGIREGLRQVGYAERYYDVPFSNYDYPVKEQERWKMLLREFRKQEIA